MLLIWQSLQWHTTLLSFDALLYSIFVLTYLHYSKEDYWIL